MSTPSLPNVAAAPGIAVHLLSEAGFLRRCGRAGSQPTEEWMERRERSHPEFESSRAQSY